MKTSWKTHGGGSAGRLTGLISESHSLCASEGNHHCISGFPSHTHASDQLCSHTSIYTHKLLTNSAHTLPSTHTSFWPTLLTHFHLHTHTLLTNSAHTLPSTHTSNEEAHTARFVHFFSYTYTIPDVNPPVCHTLHRPRLIFAQDEHLMSFSLTLHISGPYLCEEEEVNILKDRQHNYFLFGLDSAKSIIGPAAIVYSLKAL